MLHEMTIERDDVVMNNQANYYARLLNAEDKSSKVNHVGILDSTLREGEQSVGVSFSKRQRLQIAWMLDYFGVDFIEISPVISDSHRESLLEMKRAGFSAQIVSHGRALTADVDVGRACDVEWVAMYHSISDVHLQSKLHISRADALERSIRAVEYAKRHGLKLRFTVEAASHYFAIYCVIWCFDFSITFQAIQFLAFTSATSISQLSRQDSPQS